MHDVYAGLEPAELYRHFDALNAIARPSGGEAAARSYVQRVADEAGCRCAVDAAGNCVVYVRPMDGVAPVCVQAHLDMVSATAPGVAHDFDKDAIVPRRDGPMIYATGTTLGADNGIGAAAALALLTTPSLNTGPLEILFTVEEETGLRGASALDGSLLNSRYLINLDSEDPETLTIGCAGGETLTITIPAKTEPTPTGWLAVRLRAGGLQGGHSGVEIHKNRANAIKLIASWMEGQRLDSTTFRIAEIGGGSAHNAIPRDAVVVVVGPPASLHALTKGDGDAESLAALRDHIGEPNLELQWSQPAAPARSLTEASTDSVYRLLRGIPAGVRKMSSTFTGKVQTSLNVATVRLRGDAVEIVVSLRSFVADDIARLRAEIMEKAESAGAIVAVSSSYPGWEPNPSSRLLQVTTEAFEVVMGHTATVEVVHAGLECGVIADRVLQAQVAAGVAAPQPMEAISFGPRIEGAHTPEECFYPATVATTWRLLLNVIERLK